MLIRSCASTQGTWKQAVAQGRTQRLSASWRGALLSDGSVTEHLQLITGQIVETAALEQFRIGHRLTGLPENVAYIQGPRSQREVHLNTGGKVMVCATSWWNTENISRFLGDVGKLIWINLASKRTETYREITQLYYGNSPDLVRRFGHKGPFWGRETSSGMTDSR
ncbi:hypothetical protein WJX75_007865 [Coccomyxa subellipsoidea]|uniref:Uncharacterized protein n=1 Tax=Coccomyxa subellipsoidea TaxID=248742 RepID=A0ABR2YXK4_9CHLO